MSLSWIESFFRLHPVKVSDVVDILIIWFLIYKLLVLVKGTRAVQMVQGGVVIAAAYFLSRWLHMRALNQAVRYVIDYLPLFVVVIFQAEIRRLLIHIGKTPIFGGAHGRVSRDVLEEVVNAVITLSARSTGALIVIERKTGLKTYMESGIQIDAVCTYDLLVNIFNPKTPLHDGAVVIREERIAAAAVFLPLTLLPSLSKEFGSRHRATIGITEETDALAVVVSEESGAISAAANGSITRDLTAEGLMEWLHEMLEGGRDHSEPGAATPVTASPTQVEREKRA